MEELITSWEKKGREIGRKEGKAEGLEVIRSLVINQAKEKLGDISKSTIDKINLETDLTKLHHIGVKLAHIETEDELIEMLSK